MNILNVPDWISRVALPYQTYDEVPDTVFAEINANLEALPKGEPLVSVMIAAYNEEVNILRCLLSLSRMKTDIPFEVIVINNNSADKTEQSIQRLHVRGLFQGIQGCGPARQLGQENAKGQYILLADADCLYPPDWLNEMMKVLRKPGVVCVYGRYSFIPEAGFPRWQLALLEKMKDVIAELRHWKRPYLNCYGISMGYAKEYGLKAGYIMENVRGDDGRLAFDMMQYGSIRQVKSARARAWTGPRTLQRDGTFSQALFNRLKREALRFTKMFRKERPHDTKTSSND